MDATGGLLVLVAAGLVSLAAVLSATGLKNRSRPILIVGCTTSRSSTLAWVAASFIGGPIEGGSGQISGGGGGPIEGGIVDRSVAVEVEVDD